MGDERVKVTDVEVEDQVVSATLDLTAITDDGGVAPHARLHLKFWETTAPGH